jgi:hypothetical protein
MPDTNPVVLASGHDAPIGAAHENLHLEAAETAGNKSNQSNARAQLLRSAARRLRRIKGLARSDAILRRLPSSSITDGADQTDGAIVALRTLLASDLSLEELVRMSFQPELLGRELRRMQGELGREATVACTTSARTPSRDPAAARAAMLASSSFSLDSAMAPDCQAAALNGKR